MIHTDLKNQLKEAMKAKESIRVSVIRDLLASFTNELVAKGEKPDAELDDSGAELVIKRKIKQRKESIESFESAGRNELAEREKAEMTVLEEFQPAQTSDEEIVSTIKNKKAELNITDASQAGMLVGAVMKEFQGRADGARVKELVEQALS